MSAQIPDTHVDLLTGPIFATLTTLSPSGAPENTIVWCSWDGTQRPRQYGGRTPQTPKRPHRSKSGPDGLGPGGCIPLDRCARRR